MRKIHTPNSLSMSSSVSRTSHQKRLQSGQKNRACKRAATRGSTPVLLTVSRRLIASNRPGLLRCIASCTAISLICGGIPAAMGASPALLVNTEAFEQIDDGDLTANVELRFGVTNESLYWNVAKSLFNVSDDLHVENNLTSSGGLAVEDNIRAKGDFTLNSDNGAANAVLTFGNATLAQTLQFVHASQKFRLSNSLDVIGTMSGYALTVSGLRNCDTIDSNASGVLSCGTDSGAGGGLSQTSGDARYVKKSGDTMTGALTINISTVQSTSGALTIRQKTHATGALINSDTTNAPALAIDIVGTSIAPHLLFGYQGTFDTNLYRSAANTLRTNDAFVVDGDLTFGDALNDAVTVNAAAWTFANDTNFALSGGVNGLSIDTSTLSVDALNDRIGIKTTAPETELEVVGTISGRTLTIQNNSNSYILGNVGIGKSGAPNTKLEVNGTISGSQLRASNMTVSGAVVYSSGNTLRQTAKGMSGQLLISQGTNAPKWKDPLGGMIWYFDSTQAVATSKGPQITMPFALSVTGVTLKAKGAPTGAALIYDINKDGVSIFSTRPQISAGATTGGTNAIFSTTTIGSNSVLTVDIDQVGSTYAGSGITLILKGTRKY